LSIKFPLSTFIDDDASDTSAALTVVATKINGDSLPTWLPNISISGSDYVMAGTPGFTDKDFTVLLTVTDLAASGSGKFTTSFNIGIGHNISPEFREQLPDVYKQIGEPLLITISTTVCVDDDGDVLSFQIMLANGAAPPSWMTVSGVNNNIISGTPQDGDLGDFELALRCVDEVLAFDEQYFHVIVNSPPVVNEQVPNQQAPAAGGAYNFEISEKTFIDQDNKQLRWTVTLQDGSALPAWLVFDEYSHTIKAAEVPASAAGQTFTFKITATDEFDQAQSQTFTTTFLA
jgi:hypothetical protein